MITVTAVNRFFLYRVRGEDVLKRFLERVLRRVTRLVGPEQARRLWVDCRTERWLAAYGVVAQRLRPGLVQRIQVYIWYVEDLQRFRPFLSIDRWWYVIQYIHHNNKEVLISNNLPNQAHRLQLLSNGWSIDKQCLCLDSFCSGIQAHRLLMMAFHAYETLR
jgi:hypothetical protein